MKRILIVLCSCLLVGAVLAAPTTAKKKKTYCQKAGASVKAKLKGKSNGFYVFMQKGGGGAIICQDKPKFRGSFGLDDKNDKISQLRVIKKKCAFFVARASSHNPQVWKFNFADFKGGNAASASIQEVAYGQAPVTLVGVGLSKNCVVVYAYRVGGASAIQVQGTGAFGYTGLVGVGAGTAMTDQELAAVKISGSGSSATVTWSEGGAAKSFVYAAPAS